MGTINRSKSGVSRMIDLKADPELYNALRTLALGATQEDIGKDSKGNSKLFKKKYRQVLMQLNIFMKII